MINEKITSYITAGSLSKYNFTLNKMLHYIRLGRHDQRNAQVF